jgi:hypothetical protein
LLDLSLKTSQGILEGFPLLNPCFCHLKLHHLTRPAGQLLSFAQLLL